MDEPVNRAIKVSSFAVRREDVDIEIIANSSLMRVSNAQAEKEKPSYKADCSGKDHSQVECLLRCPCDLFPI